MFYKKIHKKISLFQEYQRRSKSQPGNIKLYGFWDGPNEEKWLFRFIDNLGISSRKKIALYSVFANKHLIDFDRNDIRIFFTGENVHNPPHLSYQHNLLDSPKINLSLGFDYPTESTKERYMRFPLWIMYHFKPDAHKIDIEKKCNLISRGDCRRMRSQFASIIASWDPNGLRKEIYEGLSRIDFVCSAGSWNHNDNALLNKFNDSKAEYLKNFKFNICPENSSCSGYVTEKIFDAIASGCIPIYFGNEDNTPEPDILNQDAILKWTPGQPNNDLISQIKTLHNNTDAYFEFANQRRFTENSADIIWQYYEDLRSRILQLL